MATTQEKEDLIQTLKFTPCTYTIQLWGYGGEYVMGTVDRKIYDYFRQRRLSLTDYAWDGDYADEHNIPEEMQPFQPGCWYECDDMAHVNGVDRNAGTLEICDENGNTVYQRSLEDIDGYSEDSPEIGGGDEIWIDSKPSGTVVFIGVSSEKGTFFEGEIELRAPFDITKLTISYDEIDGNEIVSMISYDGEDIDNNGGSTNGKSTDFGFYVAGSNKDGKWEVYKDMDSIEYDMTPWFPKKINPAMNGSYEVKTAGNNSYTYRAKWTGTRWIKDWDDDVESTESLKIKEWRGLSENPDEM